MQFPPLPAAMAAALMLASFQTQAGSDPNEQPAAVAESSAQPSAWKDFDGQSYRLESDGNLSCYSEDGQFCKRGTPSGDETLVKPLTCGPGLAARYNGSTGYDQLFHWCNVVYANLFAKWESYEMLGYPVLLSKTPNNDTMCMSADGTNCEWARQKGEPAPGRLIAPVVCGKALLDTKWRITGYEPERAGHWCQSPEIVATSETHPFHRSQTEDGQVTFSLELPKNAADIAAEFIVRTTAPTSSRPIVTVTDHEEVTVGTNPHPVTPGSTLAFRFLRAHEATHPHPVTPGSTLSFQFLRAHDRLQPFMARNGSTETWPRFDELRRKMNNAGPGRAVEDFWEWTAGWRAWDRRDNGTPRKAATLKIEYGKVPASFGEVPEFKMILPREKPRY